MTLLSPTDIKRIVGECDDAQLERYQRVAREQAKVVFRGGYGFLSACPPDTDREGCPSGVPSCSECWCAHLDRESQ